MAGDWIKMRPTLMTSPKVNGIARILEADTAVSQVLSTGFSGGMNEIVTRNVMRNVTVATLLTVWGAANEHTSDGVFRNADLSDVDDIAGIPGFGKAMEAVGWAVYDKENDCVILPNFSEYNTCGKDRAKERNAERQRRYREKKRAESNVTDNVTRDVTNNDREEKRREELKDNPPVSPQGDGKPKKPKFIARDAELPASVDRELWQRWCEFRASKRKPISQKAATEQIKMLSGYPPDAQAAIVQQSIQNDWQGLFPPKGANHGAHQQPGGPRSAVGRVDAAISRRAREREAVVQGRGAAVDPGGTALEADERNLRPPVDERLRGGTGGWLGGSPDGGHASHGQDGTGTDGC